MITEEKYTGAPIWKIKLEEVLKTLPFFNKRANVVPGLQQAWTFSAAEYRFNFHDNTRKVKARYEDQG